MILRAVGFGPRFPRAWLFPITSMVVLLAFAVAGTLSRSIVVDLLAWWPVWLAIAIATFVFRDSKLGTVRVAGLIPLAALVVVLVFAWGHVVGWEIMPSAAQHLAGPAPEGVTGASMTVVVDGEVTLGTETEALYGVDAIRRGGSVGLPTATEVTEDGTTAISLEAPEDPGIYQYAGWDVRLSPEVDWSLDIDAAVDADLTAIEISRLSLAGAGTVALGAATVETAVVVVGRYQLTVPIGAPVRVIGAASVPATWTLTEDGAVSPGLGSGWVMTVVGDGELTIREG